jgi:glycosyltransferase involved in cell wall biosynthesis
MRVALVVGGGVPNPTASGATLTNWTIVRYLLERGHEVVVCPLVDTEYIDPTGATLEQRVEQLEAAGATVELLRSRAVMPDVPRRRRWLHPPDAMMYPSLADRGLARGALERVRPDVVLAYHWEALAALDGVHVAPKLGVAVDLSHLPRLYRWRASMRCQPIRSLRALPQLRAYVRRQPPLMVRFLNDCEAAGNFAAHHAEWLRDHGASQCEYLRTPVPDPFADDGDTREHACDGSPRILLLGHLKGIATLEGLDLFARGVLPRLERSLGVSGFEARLVGGYEAPAGLRDALARPAVTFHGHTETAGDEFLGATALVVPTPIGLGTRVRILTAFSYGCPVVAHESNALGIPELADGSNVLLADDADGLADSIVRVVRDEKLRRQLRENGRETFERWFAPNVAAARILELLTSLAVGRQELRSGATPA